jgi:hypothetical protein
MTGNGLSQGLSDMWRSVVLFLPSFLAFLAIVIAGYLLARLARTLTTKALRRAGFDRAVQRGPAGRLLRPGTPSATDVCARLAFFVVLLFSLQLAFGIWGPNPASELINALISWLPQVFVAIVIVVVTAAIARAAHDLTLAVLGNLGYARVLAKAVTAVIITLGVIAGLDQIGIATSVTRPLLITILATVAGVIIVGVGGGLIRPMQQRWEGWLDRAATESAVIRSQARAYAEERARQTTPATSVPATSPSAGPAPAPSAQAASVPAASGSATSPSAPSAGPTSAASAPATSLPAASVPAVGPSAQSVADDYSDAGAGSSGAVTDRLADRKRSGGGTGLQDAHRAGADDVTVEVHRAPTSGRPEPTGAVAAGAAVTGVQAYEPGSGAASDNADRVHQPGTPSTTSAEPPDAVGSATALAGSRSTSADIPGTDTLPMTGKTSGPPVSHAEPGGAPARTDAPGPAESGAATSGPAPSDAGAPDPVDYGSGTSGPVGVGTSARGPVASGSVGSGTSSAASGPVVDRHPGAGEDPVEDVDRTVHADLATVGDYPEERDDWAWEARWAEEERRLRESGGDPTEIVEAQAADERPHFIPGFDRHPEDDEDPTIFVHLGTAETTLLTPGVRPASTKPSGEDEEPTVPALRHDPPPVPAGTEGESTRLLDPAGARDIGSDPARVPATMPDSDEPTTAMTRTAEPGEPTTPLNVGAPDAGEPTTTIFALRPVQGDPTIPLNTPGRASDDPATGLETGGAGAGEPTTSLVVPGGGSGKAAVEAEPDGSGAGEPTTSLLITGQAMAEPTTSLVIPAADPGERAASVVDGDSRSGEPTTSVIAHDSVSGEPTTSFVIHGAGSDDAPTTFITRGTEAGDDDDRADESRR